MTQSGEYLPILLKVLKTVGIIAPALYAGVTFAYSKVVILPLLSHSHPKLLAKQWLQAYQYGPRFVPPLVISGTICNTLLAYLSTSTFSRAHYIFAAIGTLSVMPFTIFYMEPGINGAGKWKAQLLLKDEGLVLQEWDGVGGVTIHTATQKTRKWAETVDMKDIVTKWGQVNGLRWFLAGVAAVASSVATV